VDIQFLGAARAVTGSCHFVRAGKHRILLDCGQIQGSREDEARNREPFPVRAADVDAVVLSHAHIDHSGRLPLLMREGFAGPIYTHAATHALCEIMLRDAAYLHEKDAAWENRKRERRGEALVEPLFTQDDAGRVMHQFEGVDYDERREVLPGVTIRFRDAGHILGSAIVELWLTEAGRTTKVVFSGDLGYRDAPLMPDPMTISEADVVLMESTYGDRLHRSFDDTLTELREVFTTARASRGNIVIPAFAVGRTQDLLYLLATHYDEWAIGDWHVYLDSPMAIRATEVYSRFRNLYGAPLFRSDEPIPALRKFRMSHSSAESMAINEIRSGAIIIAGSGMCSGGRVMHHLKHNVWRPECHVVIVGFQAYGTTGRKLVDGAEYIHLWGEQIRVNATIHTVGGLSAHADRDGLLDWFAGFGGKPDVYLVHGEERAQQHLRRRLEERFGVQVSIPELHERATL
jgi:metallo-beta-lactamase family protein